MAFSLVSGVITQTGINTSLSGIEVLAGVTKTNIGHSDVYDIGTLRLVVDGTLNVAQPGVNEQLRCAGDALNDFIDIEVNGTLNVGVFEANDQDYALNKTVAAIFESRDTGTDSLGGFAGTPPGTGYAGKKPFMSVLATGALNIYGRDIFTSGGIGVVAGATVNVEHSRLIGIRFYWYTSSYRLKNVTLDGDFFIVASPLEFVAVENRSTVSYISLSGSTPIGQTYTIKDVPQLPGANNLIRYGSTSITSVLNLINTFNGSDYNYQNQDSARNYTLNFKRDVQFIINDFAGSPVQDAKCQVRGKSGTVFEEITNSSGDTGEFEVDIAQRVVTSGVAVTTYFSKNDNITDIYDYRFISYLHGLLSAPTSDLKGVGLKLKELALLPDLDVTELIKATVDSYTSIDTATVFYDRAKSFLYDNYNGETQTIVNRTGTAINAGSFNLIIDSGAISVFDYDGSTIALKSSSFTDAIVTTGGVTLSGIANASLIDSSSITFETAGSYVFTRTFSGTVELINTSGGAVSVEVPTGTVVTNTGPNITVTNPIITVNSLITNLNAGSGVRIYNETTATEVFNNTVAGTSYDIDYIEGSDYSIGDIVKVVIAYSSGVTANLTKEYSALVDIDGWAILNVPEDDDVYNFNAIDGNTVIEFVADYTNIQMDLDDADGLTTPQRGYAWYVSEMMVAASREAFFGAMTAEDSLNYKINVDVVDMKVQNIGVNPVQILGARLYRSDGSPVTIPGNGTIELEYDRAYPLETGVSGLTAAESSKLLAIPETPLLTDDSRLDNLHTTAEISNEVWGKEVETYTAEEVMRVMLAALSGGREGLGSGTESYKSVDGSKARISFESDENGNGTPTLNVTP